MKKLILLFFLLSGLIVSNVQINAESIQTDLNGFEYYEYLDIVDIDAGSYISALLTSDGRVFTWGKNDKGQLGDATWVNKSTPVEITDNFGLTAGETIIHVEADGENMMALTSDSRVFTWGSNFGIMQKDNRIEKFKLSCWIIYMVE